MEKLKALEVLRKSKLFIEQQLSEFTKNTISYDYKILNEAIEELEGLESRSCNNCISSISNIVCSNKHIQKINTNYISINKYFCCNKWELKWTR